MIREIALRNFKAFKETQRLTTAPITLIYGPNSGGKSSIIQSLLLLLQSFQGTPDTPSRLVVRGNYVDLGSFRSLLHAHDETRNVGIEVSYFPNRSIIRRVTRTRLLPSSATRTVEITLGLANALNEQHPMPVAKSIRYRIGTEDVFNVAFDRLPDSSDDNEVDRRSPGGMFRFAGQEDAESYLKYIMAMRLFDSRPEQAAGQRSAPVNRDTEFTGALRHEVPAKSAVRALRKAEIVAAGILPTRVQLDYSMMMPLFDGNDSVSAKAKSIAYEQIRRIGFEYFFGPRAPISQIASELYSEFSSFSYLGPLRSPAERHYVVSGVEHPSVGVRGERAAQVIHEKGKELQGKIGEWFNIFNIPYKLKMAAMAGSDVVGEIVSIVLEDRSGVQVSPSDVGFGIGQLLPLIVEGLVASDRTICVEQPEIHLHPLLQAHFADFLIETAKRRPGPRRHGGEFGGNQWIVETHSEALMLRIMRRIREGAIPPEMISVAYVQPTFGEGSQIIPLKLNSNGEFTAEWPGGFFEERLSEML